MKIGKKVSSVTSPVITPAKKGGKVKPQEKKATGVSKKNLSGRKKGS